MKAVILAGGFGTRLSEETSIIPKPMVTVGHMPILWHIMKIYSAQGVNDFIICCGYRGYIIKEYFSNYLLHMSDVTIDMRKRDIEIHRNYAESWRVTLVDTGQDTQTGGRLRRVHSYLDGEEAFCFTYGDGLSDVPIAKTLDLHRRKKAKATVTAVYPPGRFGALEIGPDGMVHQFQEKPLGDGGRINGGYFILSPEAFDYIDGDFTLWEQEPMKQLAKEGVLAAYEHNGFWHPMDTLRDKRYLDDLWNSGEAPWKIWE